MASNDYSQTGQLFVTSNMKLDNLFIMAEVPATKLSYEVQMLDMDLGTGQIKFSHAINMEWLEENFSDFFSVSVVDDASGDETVPADFEATKFDSEEDGKVVDFTVSTFEAEESTLTMDITMDQEVFSQADALFILSPYDAGFEL